MPELRHDKLNDRWVIIAPERHGRPNSTAAAAGIQGASFEYAPDPFAEGNEAETTTEVFAIRSGGGAPNRPGWLVRVVPNKYPALIRDIGDAGYGAHEVVIETPDPQAAFHQLPLAQIELVLSTYAQRMEALYDYQRIQQVVVFKNHGPESGATIAHSHSQVIALPEVTERTLRQLKSLHQLPQAGKGELFTELRREAHESPSRVVMENDDMLAFCPYASAWPYEMLILPRSSRPHFTDTSAEERSALAAALKTCLRKLEAVLGPVSYNFVLHTAPSPTSPLVEQFQRCGYSWHVELFPRITKFGGFELGSGHFINTVAPEDAARQLRDARVSR
jgi:UDPglucose--hexose-1-phosphate uridylyltransferase